MTATILPSFKQERRFPCTSCNGFGQLGELTTRGKESRWIILSRLSPKKVKVEEIDDEAPEKIASAILRWPGYSGVKAWAHTIVDSIYVYS